MVSRVVMAKLDEVTTRLAPEEVTEDRLLRGRLTLKQPRAGYRVAMDSVLLAAALPLKPGERVLDLGCGVGAVALCLLARQPELRVVGIEQQLTLAALAEENAIANRSADRFTVEQGNYAALPEQLHGHFDQVAINPPYHDPARHRPSPNPIKAAANLDREAGLAVAVASAWRSLKHKGRLTLVHRADTLGEILVALDGFGEATICPLWPKAGRPAKRVIVSARKGVRGGSSLLPGLVLHGEDGTYTAEASAVLEAGAPLPLIA